MVEIKQQLVADNKKPKFILSGKEYTFSMVPEYIAIHETDNFKPKANAQAHANLQSNGNSRQASWHFQVDDKEIIQSFKTNEACIHGGDGVNGAGNRRSIAIEICVNEDGDFKKAVANAVELTKHLMKTHNIPIRNVRQHNAFSGKNCPRYLRSGQKGITWNQFILAVQEPTKKAEPAKPIDVKNYTVKRGDSLSRIAVNLGVKLDELVKLNKISDPNRIFAGQVLKVPSKAIAKPAPKPAPKAPAKKYTKGQDSNSIVDFLKANDVDSSLANRKKLAEAEGIKSYTGTATQNTKLLNILKKK